MKQEVPHSNALKTTAVAEDVMVVWVKMRTLNVLVVGISLKMAQQESVNTKPINALVV